MIGSVLLALLAVPAAPNAPLIASAKKAVVREFLDPASAQFRGISVKAGPISTYVCGEVNGKNAYGGYVGFRRFVFNETSGAALIEEKMATIGANAGTDFFMSWSTNCED